jgi:hypothetical protein
MVFPVLRPPKLPELGIPVGYWANKGTLNKQRMVIKNGILPCMYRKPFIEVWKTSKIE